MSLAFNKLYSSASRTKAGPPGQGLDAQLGQHRRRQQRRIAKHG